MCISRMAAGQVLFLSHILLSSFRLLLYRNLAALALLIDLISLSSSAFYRAHVHTCTCQTCVRVLFLLQIRIEPDCVRAMVDDCSFPTFLLCGIQVLMSATIQHSCPKCVRVALRR